MRIDLERRETENVVAMLGGTDSLLASQYVVHSVYYDHLSVKPDSTVFHGTDDHAFRTVTGLGIARAYALSAAKPMRSVIFLPVTGEEEDLLGSK